MRSASLTCDGTTATTRGMDKHKSWFLLDYEPACVCGCVCVWVCACVRACVPGASVRTSAHGKSHEEGSLAYAKA